MPANNHERGGLPQPSQANKILQFRAWAEAAGPRSKVINLQLQGLQTNVEEYLRVASPAPTAELEVDSGPYVEALLRVLSLLDELQNAIGEVGTTAADLTAAINADSVPLLGDPATTSE